MKESDDPTRTGDIWTFIALDADTKLVPTFRVGKRDSETANAFMTDLASRFKNRVQISTDGLAAYVQAMEKGFEGRVDYAQIVKSYETGDATYPAGKYSPGEVVNVEKTLIAGKPDMSSVSTSYVERQNLTMRMHIRRLTRLTNAFSKKLENFKAAVALHFAYYNFVRSHKPLKMTPAMAAGVERTFWTVADLVEMAGQRMGDYIKKLQDAIRRLHGCESRYLETVPVKETFQGQTVWEGEVEMFELIGHPQAQTCFAWAHSSGPEGKRERFVAVLSVPPVDSPQAAVRASIVAEFKAKKSH